MNRKVSQYPASDELETWRSRGYVYPWYYYKAIHTWINADVVAFINNHAASVPLAHCASEFSLRGGISTDMYVSMYGQWELSSVAA